MKKSMVSFLAIEKRVFHLIYRALISKKVPPSFERKTLHTPNCKILTEASKLSEFTVLGSLVSWFIVGVKCWKAVG